MDWNHLVTAVGGVVSAMAADHAIKKAESLVVDNLWQLILHLVTGRPVKAGNEGGKSMFSLDTLAAIEKSIIQAEALLARGKAVMAEIKQITSEIDAHMATAQVSKPADPSLVG